jgi:hypothetical protein
MDETTTPNINDPTNEEVAMPMTPKETVEMLTRLFEQGLEKEKEDLTKWAAKLDHNPLYAMEWGDAAVNTAARIDVYERALSIMRWVQTFDEKDVTNRMRIERLHKDATSAVLRITSIPRSTSVMSNLSETYVISEWAKILERLDLGC